MAFDLANPQRFEKLAARLVPLLTIASGVTALFGLYMALFDSPADYQQGDSVRIMYVHVPAAWMALLCYSTMAIASAIGFIFKHPLADVAAKSAAPIGAAFTFLALVTGSLWGKPMWGTWWAWDARLTSVLILFFLYIGYIALWNAIDDKIRAARLAAIVCLVGFINIPIIKFSVDWWNSLHQPASVLRAGGPTIHGSMLTPLILMGAAYALGFAALLLVSMRGELAERRIARLEQAGRPPSKATVA
ncbi:MAG: heme ABC transporter permease [Parvularculaceae bacterium]|nr:heme ABC transporter permease [Parvularculaceae bacterium]